MQYLYMEIQVSLPILDDTALRPLKRSINTAFSGFADLFRRDFAISLFCYRLPLGGNGFFRAHL